MVTVPVVVRDGKDRPVGSLTQDRFHLFDKGRAQAITRFSVETYNGKAIGAGAEITPATAAAKPAPLDNPPERFVAYLFDDMHLKFADIGRARAAALGQLAKMAKTPKPSTPLRSRTPMPLCTMPTYPSSILVPRSRNWDSHQFVIDPSGR